MVNIIKAQSDNCSSAVTLTSSTSCNFVSGTVAGATSSGMTIPGSCPSTTALDVWYKFVAQATSHTILVDPAGTYTGVSNNTYLDAVIVVYSSCSASSYIDCADDTGGGGGNCDIDLSGLTIGQTYYIRIFDYGSSQPANGNFSICVTHTNSGGGGGGSSPDLHIQSVTLTPNNSTFAAGGSIDIDYVVENLNTNATVSTATSAGAWLIPTSMACPNTVPSSTLLDNANLTVSEMSDNIENEFMSINIPANTAPGNYYLVVGVDRQNSLTESDENNNFDCTQITVSGAIVCPSSPYTNCAGTFDDGSSIGISYGNDFTCSYLIQPPNSTSIDVNFTYFQIESGFDEVFIYDGASNSDPLLWSGSGNIIPPPISSTGGSIYIEFFTDGSVVDEGWEINYTCNATPTCNYSLSSSSVSVPASGGSYSFSVVTQSNCSVDATTSCSNVTLANGNFTGSGSVSFQVSPNTTTSPITCTIDVNGQTYTINQAGCTLPTVPTITASSTSLCPNQTATISVQSPIPGASYSWSNGATGTSITVSNAGTYTVTVTIPCGTSTSQPVTVTTGSAPSQPILSASSLSVCPGQSATISVQSPIPGATYSWSNGATGTSITVSNAGTYTVTVTIPCGTSTSQPVTVTTGSAPSQPILSASSLSICPGQSATISVQSPIPGASYSWSNGATGTSITVSNAGTYTVTVTIPCGTSTSQPVTVTTGSAPSQPILSASSLSVCPGQSATISVQSPIPGATYSWSNGATGTSITVSNAGTYTVTVTIPCGTSTSQPVTVTTGSAPSQPILSASSLSVCPGQSATISVQSPIPGASYSWSNGATGTSITVSNAGTYTVTVTIPCGTSTSQPVTVTTGSAPSQPILSASSLSICPGQSATISVQSPIPGASYSWSNGATGTSITVSNAGTYTVTVTIPCGTSTSQPVTVTAGSAPSQPILSASSLSICPGQSATISVQSPIPGASYSWSNGATGTSITVSNAGTYTVTVTIPCGTSTSQPVTVTAGSAPSQPILSASSLSICSGQSGTISVQSPIPGASYSWSNGATGTSITVSNAGTYTVTVTEANGCNASTTATVVVQSSPMAIAFNNGPICIGDILYLSASGGGTYIWSGPNGYTSTMANPSIINISPQNAGTYTLTVTNTNGCTATASTNVIVNLNPSISAGSNTPVCTGNPINLTANGVGTYSWTGPNGFTSTQQNPVITNAILAASGTYTLTVTNTNGCTATESTNVTVNPSPSVSAGSNTPVCTGSPINLTANGVGTYSWTGPNGFTSTQQNPVITNAILAASGTYTLTVTNTNGCTATESTNVTVNPSPSVSVGSNSPVCTGNSINLTANGVGTYSWTGPNGFTSTQQNPVITNAILAASGTYTLTVTNTNGCTATESTNVAVNPSPSVSVGSNSPVCTGNPINLTANGVGTYSWTGPNGFTSTQQNPTIPNTTSAASGTYTLTVTNTNGCTATESTNVTVNPSPSVSVGSNSPVCTGNPINLTANGVGTYSWTGPNGFTSTQQNPVITNAILAASGTYTLTVTNTNGCTATASTNVAVNPSPSVSVGSNSPVCLGTDITLFTNNLGAYLWNGPGGFTSTLQNPVVSNAAVSNSGIYTLIFTDSSGCTNNVTTSVSVSSPPATPTISQSGCSLISSFNPFGNYQWYYDGVAITVAINQTYSATGNGWYHVEHKNNDGCGSYSSSLYLNCLTDIEQQDELLLRVYPNPADTKLTLECNGIIPSEVHLYNTLGQIVKSYPNETFTDKIILDVSPFTKGTYFLNIITEKEQFFRKIILE